ncbi:hypothetical protein D0Z03_001126 [Geotrichum reessii]|nr:hypothetical protein D0Z03_001126 [Galactomyces reessii]
MFNYFQAGVGALLLHISSTSFIYDDGRVLGCSSLLYRAITAPGIFTTGPVVGMIASAAAVSTFFPENFQPDYSALSPSVSALGAWTVPLAGLLVGVGTKLGAGCTSGHMLIGLARCSLRSLVAAATFTSVAMLTTFLTGAAPVSSPPPYTIVNPSPADIKFLFALLAATYATRHLLRKFVYRPGNAFSQFISSIFAGATFGLGLLISGMASPGTTLGFLALPTPSRFNPSLLMVVALGLVPNFIEYWIKREDPAPTCVDKYELPTDLTTITPRLVLGSAIFGIGWGISGICPGPGVLGAVLNGKDGLVWLATFLMGYGTAANVL